jgi:hypothetical protein
MQARPDLWKPHSREYDLHLVIDLADVAERNESAVTQFRYRREEDGPRTEAVSRIHQGIFFFFVEAANDKLA